MTWGKFHKTAKQKLGLSSFLNEKFTLIPYHKILSLNLRYFMKLAPGRQGHLTSNHVTFGGSVTVNIRCPYSLVGKARQPGTRYIYI